MRRNPSVIRLVLWLAFDPRSLVDASVDEALSRNSSADGSERESSLRASFQKQFENAVAVQRRTLSRSFVIVSGAIAAALIAGIILSQLHVPSTPATDSALQYAGIAILLWATIGRADRAIETMDEPSYPEIADLAVYNWLYILGSFLLALPMAW